MDSTLGILAAATVGVFVIFLLLLLGPFQRRAFRILLWTLLAIGLAYLVFGIIELAT